MQCTCATSKQGVHVLIMHSICTQVTNTPSLCLDCLSLSLSHLSDVARASEGAWQRGHPAGHHGMAGRAVHAGGGGVLPGKQRRGG